MSLRFNVFETRGGIVVALAAALAIIGAVSTSLGMDPAWRWLYWVAKPIATGLILWGVWRVASPVSTAYRRRILAGVVFSLAGDVCLMLPGDLFVPGLVCFLLAHLCFIFAFTSDAPLLARRLPFVISLGFGAAMLAVLWHGLPAALRAPVIAYVLALGSMVGQAHARRLYLGGPRPATLAAWGAVFFMASDSLLALDKFLVALPLSELWILATYYLAMWLIGRSVQGRSE